MQTTSVDVLLPFNTLQRLNHIHSAVLRQREYEHDLLTVDVWGYRGKSLKLRTNDLAVASLRGAGEKPIGFVGYVHDVEEVPTGHSGSHHHRVTFIAPSFLMKQSTQKIWRNVTVGDIVRSIAKKYHFAARVRDADHFRIPVLHQAGLTDWAFLCRIAKQYGLVVYANKVTLTVRKRDADIQEIGLSARLTYRETKAVENTQIWEFTAMMGENNQPASMKAKHIVQGVDPRTAKIFGSVSRGKPVLSFRDAQVEARFFRHHTHDVVHHTTDADLKTAGHDEITRYPHRAKAYTDGRSRVHQSGLIYLTGFEGEYDGYWHVIEVRHEFNNEYRYRMHMELGTESLGRPVLVAPPEDGVIIPPSLLTESDDDPDPILITPDAPGDPQTDDPTDPSLPSAPGTPVAPSDPTDPIFGIPIGPIWGSPVVTVDVPVDVPYPAFVRGRACCVC